LKHLLSTSLIFCFVFSLWSCEEQVQEQTAPLPNQTNDALAKKITYMNNVISENPNVAEYYFRRAALNLEANKENLAQKDIDQALVLDSSKAEYYFIKAKIHEIRREYDSSLYAGKKAEQMGYKEIDADMLMGKMNFYAKNYPKANEYFKKVEEALPNLPQLWYYKGINFFQLKDTAQSISSLRQALRLKQDYCEVYQALVDIYNNYGAYKIALQYARIATAQCPQQASFYFALGRSMWAMRSYDSAIVLYSRAFDMDSTIWQAGYQVATYCISKQNYVTAEKYLVKALRQKPNIERGHYLLGAIYEYHLKKMNEALRSYQRASLADRENIQIQTDIRRVVKKIEYEEYKKSPQFTLDLLKRQQEAQLQQQIPKKDSL
jgi:tetratricopeptide (TPR) repeat protein